MVKSKKKSNFISIGKLAGLSGLRASTIKFYTEQGLLLYEQQEEGLMRHYDKAKAMQRLKEIKELQEKERRTIKEIIKRFK